MSTMSVSEAFKILNLDQKKKVTKEDINKAYTKIQKKISFKIHKQIKIKEKTLIDKIPKNIIKLKINGGSGGMVDTLVLGTSSATSEGSSPFSRTIKG